MKTATISLYTDESGSCCTLYGGDQTKAEELPEEEVAAIVGDTGEQEETKLCLYIIDKALLLGYDHLVLDDSFATYSSDVEMTVRFVNREKKLQAKVDADFDRLTTRQKIELGLQAAKAIAAARNKRGDKS